MQQHELEQLIRTIAEEVLDYLGAGGTAPAGAETEEAPCTDCDQRCIERCARRAKQVMAAGADRLSASAPISAVDADLAPLIDHTLLKPEATRDDIERLCQEALRFGFASVVVNPWYVPLAAERVRGSRVRVCTVVGFPLGATLPQVKLYETEQVLKLGAEEVDMVLNIGALKSGQDEVVESDIRGVVEACHRGGAICKVILETALLTLEEKVRACLASKHAGADFVKTSTGFGPGGATAEDVALMRCVVGPEMGVKAAGGIRSLEELRRMVAAGATRIGASASVRILEEARTGTADRSAQTERPAAGSAPSIRIPY
jgi:deoxyribose-phosphate aldolase